MCGTTGVGEVILFHIKNKNLDRILINRAATNVQYHYMCITAALVRVWVCIRDLTLRKHTQKHNSPARCYFAQA